VPLWVGIPSAGLVDVLNDPATKLTIFAPNDRAFILLARDLGFAWHRSHDQQGAPAGESLELPRQG